MIAEALSRVRRNHALEHATVAVLLEQGFGPPLGGYSTPGGFLVFGRVPTDAVVQAARDALQQLRDGQHERAVSPYCGTNILTGALLAGLASLLILGRKGSRLQRLPTAVAAIVGTTIVSRPIGNTIQRRYTTLSDMTGVEIRKIIPLWARPGGRFTVHSVRTAFTAEQISP